MRRRKSRGTVSEFMNGEDISNAWLPAMPHSSDLRGLRSRMIKLLNLPWNPPPAMKWGTAKERKRGCGRNSGAHSFDGSVIKISRDTRRFNREEEGRREMQV